VTARKFQFLRIEPHGYREEKSIRDRGSGFRKSIILGTSNSSENRSQTGMQQHSFYFLPSLTSQRVTSRWL